MGLWPARDIDNPALREDGHWQEEQRLLQALLGLQFVQGASMHSFSFSQKAYPCKKARCPAWTDEHHKPRSER